MAISSELIGSLGGGGEVTQSRFWFSSADRYLSELNQTWNVPRGNYLFAWQGTLQSLYATGTNPIFINGQTIIEIPANAQGIIGGYTILYNVAKISLTGDGRKRFVEDPYAVFVKVK